MRFVQISALASILGIAALTSGSCAGGEQSPMETEEPLTLPSGMASSAPSMAVTGAPSPAVTSSSSAAASTTAAPTTQMQMPTTSPSMTSTPGEEDDEPTAMPTMTAEEMEVPPVQDCTDEKPTTVGAQDADVPCETWAEWGECENSNGWLDEFCDLSCGRCTPGAPDVTSNPSSTEPAPMMSMMPGDGDPGGGEPGGGELGDDNPYGSVEGGTPGFATRYWDCCKPSCGWRANASRGVVSCDKADNNVGVTDDRNACEQGGQSGAFTCHRMAPWAHSTQLSYGYAAINGVSCGTCFHVTFDGSGQHDGNDPGSRELQGKSMVVMATNIGGIQQNQFDLLIPGGGVGDFNGCSGQWGVDNTELGAQYGGFLTVCRQSNGDHEAVKQCMRDKCDSIFGSRGLTELQEGCMWFVDWFKVADNPKFNYKQVDCPEVLNQNAY